MKPVKFGIFCEVSGGVTGYRCAWLKSEGREVEFDNEADARTEANTLNQRNGNPHSTANFRYTVRPRPS